MSGCFLTLKAPHLHIVIKSLDAVIRMDDGRFFGVPAADVLGYHQSDEEDVAFG
jgi:hypothetical protein